MRVLFLSVLFSIAVLSLAEEKEKLRIGIKHRVPAEECTRKSKKGDTLEMHYTVSKALLGKQLNNFLYQL